MKEQLKRIADALEKIAQPLELDEVEQEMPEPVCPVCQATDPLVFITADQATQVRLSGAMTFSLTVKCLECGAQIELKPRHIELIKMEES